MHAVHHPERIRPEREWVDWFTEFKADGHGKTVGLEFQEGLWAEKLAIIAILITVAIIVVSVIWAVRGGQLQTVFTVMSFVLTAAAGEVLSMPFMILVLGVRLTRHQLRLHWRLSTIKSHSPVEFFVAHLKTKSNHKLQG